MLVGVRVLRKSAISLLLFLPPSCSRLRISAIGPGSDSSLCLLYAARTTWPNSQNNGFTLDWVIGEQAQCQQPAKQISVGRQQRLQPLRFVSLASWMSQPGYDWQATRVSFSHVQHGPPIERLFEQQNTNPFLLMALSRQELRNEHREHAIWPVTHIRRPNLP